MGLKDCSTLESNISVTYRGRNIEASLRCACGAMRAREMVRMCVDRAAMGSPLVRELDLAEAARWDEWGQGWLAEGARLVGPRAA